MSHKPFISVIVPAYQSEAHIQDVLQSLKNQEYPQDRFEVVIVVSGEDNTINICKSFQKGMQNLKIHNFKERISAGYARNIGASLAKGDIFLFIDSDCIAPPNWIRLIVKNFDEFPEVYGVIGTYSGGKSLITKIIGGELVDTQKKVGMFPSLIEGNCAFKKTIFEKGCKFGDITYGEVTILVSCMKEKGFKTLLDPESHVMHLGTFSLLKYSRMCYSFYFWHLMSKSNQKGLILKAIVKSSFVLVSLFLLSLIPFFGLLPFYQIIGFPILCLLSLPILLVNIVFLGYIKRDFLVSRINKLKYFPYLILMRWFHQFGYFFASFKALYCILKNRC
jgi:glycosyltransferase involved in cell wall biosynthesis